MTTPHWSKRWCAPENSVFTTKEKNFSSVSSQLRICHMWEGAGKIAFGVYACSPEDSSFTAVFFPGPVGALQRPERRVPYPGGLLYCADAPR